MEQDRLKWDKKWSEKAEAGEPLPLIRRYLNQLPLGRALDLACGRGRHALLLAQAGFAVDAVDISPVALAALNHPSIKALAVDLDHWTLPVNSYDVIVDTYFLDRRLMPQISAALRPGGWLLFETFLAENKTPANPRFKLTPGELAQTFAHLQHVYYQERDGIAGMAAINTSSLL